MVKQGDIIQISFDPSIGHEQKKTRPALVVSSNRFNVLTRAALLCPISHAKDFPLHIDLPAGIRTDGKVLCEHIRSMDIETRGYTKIETVPQEFMNYISELCQLLFRQN